LAGSLIVAALQDDSAAGKSGPAVCGRGRKSSSTRLGRLGRKDCGNLQSECRRKSPDVIGVISGNDEMVRGAIVAFEDGG